MEPGLVAITTSEWMAPLSPNAVVSRWLPVCFVDVVWFHAFRRVLYGVHMPKMVVFETSLPGLSYNVSVGVCTLLVVEKFAIEKWFRVRYCGDRRTAALSPVSNERGP